MKVSWRNVSVLLRNDLAMSLRSKGFIFILGIPLVLSLVIGFATRKAPVTAAEIVILGESQGEFARFVSQARLGTTSAFKVMKMDEKEAQAALEKGKIDGILVLAPGTSEQLKSGRDVDIQLTVDESSPSMAAMLPNILRELGRAYAKVRDPFRIQVRGIRGITTSQSTLPMWVIMALLSGISMLPAVLAAERQTKTLDALLVTPLSFLDVIIGRAAYGVVMGALGSFILLAANGGLVGNQLLVWTFILVGAVMSVLLGLFVGLVRKDVQSASMIASLLYVVLIWGVAFSELPGITSKFSKVMPSYYLANGMREALFTTVSWSEQLVNLAVPLGVAVVAFIGCLLALRKQEA